MEFLKGMFFKFFSKEKLFAYAIGGLVTVGSAALVLDQKKVEEHVCKDVSVAAPGVPVVAPLVEVKK